MARRVQGRRVARSRERGQSLVELAVVTPFLLLLLMGVVDAGRIIFAYIALEDAVQEGTIYMAHEPSSPSDVVYRVQSSSNHPEVTNATINPATDVVCVPPSGSTPGTVSVTARYNLPILTPIASEIFGGTFAMRVTFTGTNFKGSC